jgi:hypothetical protein
MTRKDIFDTFRAEYPEYDIRVLSDTLLASWCLVGDKFICAQSRCIVSDSTFNSVVTTSIYDTKYDLSALLTKFYDIDTYPGAGVIYNEVPLDKKTVSQLDAENSNWRSADAGTPEAWYRRGKYLYFDKPVSAVKTVRVYYVQVSDDFNNDNLTPYNQLSYLEPFHYGMVKYLGWKAALKSGKPTDAAAASTELMAYITWMKKELGGGKYATISMHGPSTPTNAYGI